MTDHDAPIVPYLPPPVGQAVNGELYGGPFDGCILLNYVINRCIGFNPITNLDVIAPYTEMTIVEVFTPTHIKVYDARRHNTFYRHDGDKWRYSKMS